MDEVVCIHVVDDDQAVLMSVRAVLVDLKCDTRCYSSAEQFLSEADISRPGCLITDLQMPGITGLELQQRLIRSGSPLSIVVVTGVADISTAVNLMKLGAVTLLAKPYEPATLLGAAREALAMSQQRWEQDQTQQDIAKRLSELTVEERQIMQAMLANKTNKAIAQQLNLSMRTMDRRRSAILETMRVKSVAELAALLSRLPPDEGSQESTS